MGRQQAIQNALIAINEAEFQELCDHFLMLKNNNYALLSRSGSQVGKQKTVKGTPDTLILLPTGKYLLVEYSTNVTKGYKKIYDDINKCLDPTHTHIPQEAIAEIIICLNFNLKNQEAEKLRQLVAHTYISLTIYTLDALGLELQFQHRNLVHEYLGLPMDTGQIVSIEQFIKEYDRAGNHIATPLNNPYLKREAEGEELLRDLAGSDFIIVTGAPGVGKTKLALETIRQFVSANPSYRAYCISNKNAELITDLYQYLTPEHDFILFVDDANRIDTFSQIVGFYRNLRKGKLKIMVTVRDYAYTQVSALCRDFAAVTLDLPKMKDEQILNVIKDEPFTILNPLYADPIIRIADGNPRMAIMAALLSRKHETPLVLKDVSDLFDQYFSTFIRDSNEFDRVINLKCLGLIAFFYTLNFKDKEIITPILTDFGIEYHEFINTIDRLEKLELIELQFEHVKISEQNLGIYFFYQAFIKQQLLSFEILLQQYFQQQKNRFRECVIAALNTFDDELILQRIKPQLAAYLQEIYQTPSFVLAFLNIFWYFLPLETLSYCYTLIKSLPEPATSDYVFDAPNKKQHHYPADELIEILGEFYRTGYEIENALACGMAYISKLPEKGQEYTGVLKRNMAFSHHDDRNGYFRQKAVIQYFTERIALDDYLATLLFFELAKLWLKFSFQHTENTRGNALQIYRYEIQLTSEIKYFRSTIWDTLHKLYPNYPNEILQVLVEYGHISPDTVAEVMEFDVPYVINIIQTHLNPDSFEHCRYVQSQIRWFMRKGMRHPRFNDLKERFVNPTYRMYLKIDWDQLRDKEIFEYADYREYEKLKAEEIRTSFLFNEKNEVVEFYQNFVFLKKSAKNDWSYNNSLDMVIEGNFEHNPVMGIALLQTIIAGNNLIGYVPRRLFHIILKSAAIAAAIKKLIWLTEYQHKEEWQLSYLEQLGDELMEQTDVDLLLTTIRQFSTPVTIHFDHFVKYLKVSPTLFENMLQLIYQANAQRQAGIQIGMDFYADHFALIEKNLPLSEAAYLQQINLNDFYFDFEMKGLKKILAVDPAFLVIFIQTLRTDHLIERNNLDLSFVWEIPQIQQHLSVIFDQFSEDSMHWGLSETFLNAFFSHLTEQQKEKADLFLINYVEQNAHHPRLINLMVDIVRHTRKELFETILLKYVSLNPDVEDFDRIYWRGNGVTTHGDTITGDIEAADWRHILSMIERGSNGLEILPIRKYISDRIDGALRHGDWERKRRFLRRN